jgi:hypothetical protein
MIITGTSISPVGWPATTSQLFASRFVTDIFELLGRAALWADAPNLIALRIAKADNLTLIAAPFAFGTAE